MSKPFKTVNGVDIFLSNIGKFSAEIGGEMVVSPTLAALEKKIVKAPAKYQPRDAVNFVYGDRFERIQIVGLKKRSSRSDWGAKYFYLIRDKGGRHWRTDAPTTDTGQQFYEDREEVHAAYEIYREEYNKLEKEIDLLKDKQRVAKALMMSKVSKYRLPDSETAARELGLLENDKVQS